MPDPLPDDPPSAIRLPAFTGSKAKAEAFKRRVQDDPFPTAGQAGVARAVVEE